MIRWRKERRTPLHKISSIITENLSPPATTQRQTSIHKLTANIIIIIIRLTNHLRSGSEATFVLSFATTKITTSSTDADVTLDLSLPSAFFSLKFFTITRTELRSLGLSFRLFHIFLQSPLLYFIIFCAFFRDRWDWNYGREATV